jgi:quercetin dioxygenase-like cupin family protein
MRRLPFTRVMLLAGLFASAASYGAAQQPARVTSGASIIEHDADVAVSEPGTHGGGGMTVGYSFFKNAPGLKLVFRKRALKPGSGIGNHEQKEDEIYYVLSGKGVLTLDGKTYDVGPGAAILTRPGSSHGLKQVGTEDLVILINYEVARPPAQADPFNGTWKLNLSKSTFDPGPAPKSGTAFIASSGDSVKLINEGVTAAGVTARWEYVANHDGKDYPMKGSPDADVLSLKRINPSTVESTYKKGGKVTLVNTRTVSADGKTMTVTVKGTNAQGQKVNNVLVYEKG